MIAKDGEGATKLMEVIVKQAKTFEDAKKVAKSVALSYLTKSAFGVMPIFGRVMAAAGYSGADILPEKMDVYFGDEMVVNNGIKADYDKQKINKILKCEENNEGKECNKEKKITITIDLNQGKETATAWGCDLTKEYVDINAGYYT